MMAGRVRRPRRAKGVVRDMGSQVDRVYRYTRKQRLLVCVLVYLVYLPTSLRL
jgi:hypothetical protein